MFKIINHIQHEFYTSYSIIYKGKTYTCNYNGGIPKLDGIRLSERLYCELSDIIEEYFLDVICKK